MAKTTLSPIIAGTMNWGSAQKNLNTAQMAHRIHLCCEHGLSTFDHADIYGGYTTEAQFGEAFTASKIQREKVQFISKCGIQHTAGRDNKIKHYDYSKKYLIWSVENSLKNLQTDYLDILLLHRPSPLMVADEVAEAVAQLKSDGKIIDFGLSNFTPSQTELLRQQNEIGFNQIQFSATQYQAMTDGSLDYMQSHNIRPMAWNPLGNLFREDNLQTQRLKAILDKLGEKYGVAQDILLLAWILKHPAHIIPVAGTANPDRIKALPKALSLDLDKLDWFAIWTASMGNKVP